MDKAKLNKLIKKRVNDDLKERGLKKINLTSYEYCQELYQMALSMLIEQGR